MLDRMLRDLGEAAPLAILLGTALGAGVVILLTGTVGESSSESLEVLVLGSLQVLVPLGVCAIWIVRLAPLQVQEAARWRLRSGRAHTRRLERPPGPAPQELAAAVLTCLALMPWFGGALLLGGLLATPRSELGLASELQELFQLMTPNDLVQSLLRTTVFAATAVAICLRKGGQVRHSFEELPRLIADAVPECLLVVTALQAAWLTLVPLHGTVA